MFKVYRIVNKINNKVYIGITSRNINMRYEEHISRARCGQRKSRLYDAVRKYGKENFILSEIDKTDSEDAVRKLETKYINIYDSYNSGYNCNLGGCGHLHIPDELKKKISDAQKGKIISEETKRKMSEAKKGNSSCSAHFGNYTNKGKNNPKAKSYLIQTPDGEKIKITGIRQFCRENNLNQGSFNYRKKTKGFKILRTFNDYPEMEYSQVTGKGAHPYKTKDEDIVCSA